MMMAECEMKKLKKRTFGETVRKIWREHGLECAADSPKIGDFEPARSSSPQGNNDDPHAPVAHLERQHLEPIRHAVGANENEITGVIDDEERGQRSDDDSFSAPRIGKGTQQKRQRDCDDDDDEMG